MITADILDGISVGLESLSAGAGILGLLGILCIWVWTLIIMTALGLRSAVRPTGAAAGACLLRRTERAVNSRPQRNCNGDCIVEQHRLFCRALNSKRLNGRLQKRIVRAHIDIAMRQFSKNVGTILLLSSLAPLLGLLGTVDGMIGTFRALAEAGNTGNAALTEGISKALVTTQGGLLVAIPSLLAGGVLYRKTRKLRNTLRSVSLRSEASGEILNHNSCCAGGGA